MAFSFSEKQRRFRRWRRGIWRRLGKRLLDCSVRPDRSLRERLSVPGAKVLFLFNAGKIGDCICSTFVFRELKKAFPRVEIHVLCSLNVASVLEHCENVDCVWSMKHSFRVLEFVVAGLRLRRFRYELAVARDGGVRTRELLFFRLLGAAEYLGYFMGCKPSEALLAEFPSVKPPDFLSEYTLSGLKIFSRTVATGGRGIRDVKGDVLRAAGIEKFSDEYDCPRDAAAEKEICSFLAKEKIETGKFVALNLFGNGESRKISEDNAFVLIKRLHEKYAPLGWKCVLLSSPKDDAAVARVLSRWTESRGDVGSDFLAALRPTTSIFQNIELIAKSGFLVSPDTSVVHAGDAFGIPMLVFICSSKLMTALALPIWTPHERPASRCLFFVNNVNEIDFSSVPL